jgi:hypothetical protein
MRITASFEDGALHLLLTPETPAEQRMIGAVIDQPQDEESCAYMDKSLIAASVRYDGHWSNKSVSSVRLSVYRPNRKDSA